MSETGVLQRCWLLNSGDYIYSTLGGWERIDEAVLVLVVDMVRGVPTPRTMVQLTIKGFMSMFDSTARFTTRKA